MKTLQGCSSIYNLMDSEIANRIPDGNTNIQIAIGITTTIMEHDTGLDQLIDAIKTVDGKLATCTKNIITRCSSFYI